VVLNIVRDCPVMDNRHYDVEFVNVHLPHVVVLTLNNTLRKWAARAETFCSAIWACAIT
jgi:hypothetical protein